MLIDILFVCGVAYGSFWLGGKCEGSPKKLWKLIDDKVKGAP